MRDDLFSDPDEEMDDDDSEEIEGDFDDDDIVSELESDEARSPIENGDENAVRAIDDNEADESEAGGMEQFSCAYCGEMNEVFVDRTASKRQQFTEDCEVCCRPNLVSIFFDPDGGVWVDADQEDDA